MSSNFPELHETPTSGDQHKLLLHHLENLRLLVANLPKDLPAGLPDGPLYQYFGAIDEDEEEGLYVAVDKAYLRAFRQSGTEEEKLRLITGGPYGVEVVYQYFKCISQRTDLAAHDGYYLTALKISQINTLIGRVIRNARQADGSAGHLLSLPLGSAAGDVMIASGGSHSVPVATMRQGPSPALGKRKSGTLGTNPRYLLDTPEINRMIDRDIFGIRRPDDDTTAAPERQNKKPRKPTKKGANPPTPSESGNTGVIIVDDASSSESSDSESVNPTRRGRAPTKSRWARAQFGNEPKACKLSSGKYIWKWHCCWCNTFRTMPRSSKSVTKFDDEPTPPTLSNLISHLDRQCSKIPESHSFGMWQATESSGSAGNAAAVLGGSTAQRQILAEFVREGVENPKVELTQRGFRERFVKGVIADDLPFVFGEKLGMNTLFKYILPKGYEVPNASKTSRDADRLYEAIDKKLTDQMQKNRSKISFATDIWTSKSSVYGYIGLVAYWISDDWELMEVPIALIPVNGDHSGLASAKAIFRELTRRGIADKYFAHAADNTSSNGSMTEALCHRLSKYAKTITAVVPLSANDCYVGCGLHVGNLAVQDLLFGLGLAVNPEEEDLYLCNKSEISPLENFEAGEAAEEAALAREELNLAKKGRLPETAQLPDTDSELSEACDDEEGGDIEQFGVLAGQVRPTKQKRTMTVVDQLHAIVVDILRSEPRRKKMREITRKVCSTEVSSLTLVRGMPIRWNSTLAEIERALLLRPAIMHWVEALPDGLRGKKQDAAIKKQKRLHIGPDGWRFLADLVDILTPFKQFTLTLSEQKVPTLPQLLPLYKLLEKHLDSCREDPRFAPSNIQKALKLAQEKLRKHLVIALTKKYPLLASVLHPAIRVKYFQSNDWPPGVATQAEKLLREVYILYSSKTRSSSDPSTHGHSHLGVRQANATHNSSPAPPLSIFAAAIASQSNNAALPDQLASEVELFLSGVYPIHDEDFLGWWKMHENVFPVLSRIARDVFALPAVSVSVERLFSSCKHTMSDERSSFTAKKAASTVITKEWLRKGWGEGVEHLDGVSIWRKNEN